MLETRPTKHARFAPACLEHLNEDVSSLCPQASIIYSQAHTFGKKIHIPIYSSLRKTIRLYKKGPLRKEQPVYKYEQQITACTCKSANGQSAIKTLGFKCVVIYSHCGKGGEAEELRRCSKSRETCPSETAEVKPVTFKTGFCQICSANWGKA